MMTRFNPRDPSTAALVVALAVLAALGTIAILAGGPEQAASTRPTTTTASAAPTTARATSVTAAAPSSTTTTMPTTTRAPEPTLTPVQQNAVRSAESYLDFMSFSRDGLIHQLSSEHGEQFPVADATIAVDSLNVDWDTQAVESARAYLDFMGFSCRGLIDQLSSDHGDRFTVGQATYGAEQAGACG